MKDVVIVKCENCNKTANLPVLLYIEKAVYTGKEKCKDCGGELTLVR